jgi:hypothetical protein
MEAVLAVLIATLMILLFHVQGAWLAPAISIGGLGFDIFMIILVLKWLFNIQINFPRRKSK